MTCSIQCVLEVYFYEAISKCKVQHTKKTNLNWVAGASYKSGKIGFHHIASPEALSKPLQCS